MQLKGYMCLMLWLQGHSQARPVPRITPMRVCCASVRKMTGEVVLRLPVACTHADNIFVKPA